MTLPKFSSRAGFLVGLGITPIAFFLALYSAGAGHGDNVLARLLYPIPMLATLLTNTTITGLSIGLAALQFPAYGVFVARGERFWWPALGVFHLAAIVAAFSGAARNTPRFVGSMSRTSSISQIWWIAIIRASRTSLFRQCANTQCGANGEGAVCRCRQSSIWLWPPSHPKVA
ncbi:hypothetical protein [Mesorhizobium caraganae]|uniref:hypothetical protein n=1 Tax=Mesorhizobium caraganae TaxID=483206 RepID=UPI003ECCA233